MSIFFSIWASLSSNFPFSSISRLYFSSRLSRISWWLLFMTAASCSKSDCYWFSNPSTVSNCLLFPIDPSLIRATICSLASCRFLYMPDVWSLSSRDRVTRPALGRSTLSGWCGRGHWGLIPSVILLNLATPRISSFVMNSMSLLTLLITAWSISYLVICF